MAHLSKQEVIAKIRAVLAKHGVASDVKLSECEGFKQIDVELGYEHIDNDQLINELHDILWKNTADVEICPCRDVFSSNKTYL